MKRILLTGLLAAAPLALSAGDAETDTEARYPQQMSARDLLTTCASSSLTRTGRERRRYCAGFVSGVEEGVRLLETLSGGPAALCVPADVTAQAMAEIYVRYASAPRRDIDQPAAAVVLDALRHAFSCAPES